MKAWRGAADDLTDEPPQAPDAAVLDDLRRRGIDLDPDGHGEAHVHGPGEAPHSHPHAHAAAGEPPIIGIVGAGAVGTALGAALSRAGWPVAAVASRDPARRERFRSYVPGARAFAEANP